MLQLCDLATPASRVLQLHVPSILRGEGCRELIDKIKARLEMPLFA